MKGKNNSKKNKELKLSKKRDKNNSKKKKEEESGKITKNNNNKSRISWFKNFIQSKKILSESKNNDNKK